MGSGTNKVLVIPVFFITYSLKTTNIIIKANSPDSNVSKKNYPRKPRVLVLVLSLSSEAIKISVKNAGSGTRL